MRCPKCNAHNAESATFCTLCHMSFTAPSTEVDQDASPASDDVEGDLPGLGPTARAEAESGAEPAATATDATSDSAAVKTASRGVFRRTTEGFDWRCARCLEWNPLELTACSVCQHPFRETMAPPARKERAEITSSAALGMSALAPGLAHVATGRNATGLMRFVLFAVCCFGGVALQVQVSRSPGAPPLVAVPLLLGALIIWAATMVDASRLAEGTDRSVLSPRTYLWLLVTVLVLMLAAALPAIFRAAQPDEDPGPVIGDLEAPPTGDGVDTPTPSTTETPSPPVPPTDPVG